MKKAIFITARLGSSRLPQKHIQSVGEGLTCLELLISRMETTGLPVVLVTSDEAMNKPFEKLSAKMGIEIFYGSVNNIPKRHVDAAKKFEVDFIFGIDGDDIFCAPEGVNKISSKLDSEEIGPDNFICIKGYPFGMNPISYSSKFLEKSLSRVTEGQLETGWGRIFPPDKIVNLEIKSRNEDNWRLTLDYEEDLEVFRAVVREIGIERILTSSSTEILDVFSSKSIWKLNESMIEGYWENFNSQVDKEKSNV